MGSFTGSAYRLHPMGPVAPCSVAMDETMRNRRAAPWPGRFPGRRPARNSLVNMGR